jgi:hypothetical protein
MTGERGDRLDVIGREAREIIDLIAAGVRAERGGFERAKGGYLDEAGERLGRLIATNQGAVDAQRAEIVATVEKMADAEPKGSGERAVLLAAASGIRVKWGQ